MDYVNNLEFWQQLQADYLANTEFTYLCDIKTPLYDGKDFGLLWRWNNDFHDKVKDWAVEFLEQNREKYSEFTVIIFGNQVFSLKEVDGSDIPRERQIRVEFLEWIVQRCNAFRFWNTIKEEFVSGNANFLCNGSNTFNEHWVKHSNIVIELASAFLRDHGDLYKKWHVVDTKLLIKSLQNVVDCQLFTYDYLPRTDQDFDREYYCERERFIRMAFLDWCIKVCS